MDSREDFNLQASGPEELRQIIVNNVSEISLPDLVNENGNKEDQIEGEEPLPIPDDPVDLPINLLALEYPILWNLLDDEPEMNNAQALEEPADLDHNQLTVANVERLMQELNFSEDGANMDAREYAAAMRVIFWLGDQQEMDQTGQGPSGY